METELRGKRVTVTGASGFIGRRLVPALVAAGAEVTVLGRSPAPAALPRGVRHLRGDLGDPAALGPALAGAAVLCNLAYDLRAGAAANLAGFETLLAAAGRAGVGRIVHLSSIVVYDAWPGADCTEAGTMARPGGGGYRQAKIAMEKRLMAGPVPVAILQPTIVWGAGSALWTDGFADALLAGGVELPDPEGLCNGVHVDDVVQTCLLAARLGDLGRERFIVSGPAPFAWSALIEGYAALLGRGRVIRTPAAEIAARLGPRPVIADDAPPSAAARISALGRRLLGHQRFEALVRKLRRGRPGDGILRPDHHLLEEFTGTGICHVDLARARLGYAPVFDLGRGLAETAGYLRARAR
ncbi:MAG: NAD(P)H-binding protein [Defluviimonas sp.]|nr:NAD(P)H-binding protein [Defluviimonas sp.]